MLRYSFLPSDFHPQFLILGERSELASLVLTLRGFAQTPDRLPIDHMAASDPGRDVRLSLVPDTEAAGLRRAAEGSSEFEWHLNGPAAEAIANLIQETIESSDPAGSVVLEIGAPEEIPVKVSYGEFTDQFLVEDF